MRIAIHTLGCKLNQAESELLARQFIREGHNIVSGEQADIHIINTCTVTHIADRKSRHLVRMWGKRDPQALIVATGCYAQRAPEDLSGVGAGLVVNNEQKMQLPAMVQNKRLARDSAAVDTNNVSRIRSFIKIQDGCNDACAYCIVPQVRGTEHSLPPEDIINEVEARIADGYKEIVFTGTKVGNYNHKDVNLAQLIERVLQIRGLQRLHISSLQPQDISPELLELWRDTRLCRHFHLALQSGSSGVLKRMRRSYSVDDYSRTVSSIRRTVLDVAITTDIMVGFPGETNEEFEAGYRFCKEMGFAAIHVFTYSARPGTSAAPMREQISDEIKKQRSQRMLRLAKDGADRFNERFIGKELTVLWENRVKPGSDIYSGLSHNYIRTFTRSSRQLDNCLNVATASRLDKEGLWVKIKSENKD